VINKDRSIGANYSTISGSCQRILGTVFVVAEIRKLFSKKRDEINVPRLSGSGFSQIEINMLAKVSTSALCGIRAVPVVVEVYVGRSGEKWKFDIIGLGDSAIREATDRVQTAIKSSGFWLPKQVLVNLAPAELRKEGSSFDLPVAVGILLASGQLKLKQNNQTTFIGELSLNGELKSIRGIAAIAIQAIEAGTKRLIVPLDNLPEASLFEDIEVLGARSLQELAQYLVGNTELTAYHKKACHRSIEPQSQISEVIGQEQAKRAATIAAAGGHNLL
jgi:magnesium chelatase family protein